MKSKRDNGFPYLNPLQLLKKLEEELLAAMENTQ